MFKLKLKQRQLFTLASACVLAFASLLPLIEAQTANAAGQLTNRSVTISSSVVSATSVTYKASFEASSTTVVKGIVIDVCQNSPLIGVACTLTHGITATPTSGSITVSKTGAAPNSVSMAVDASSTGTGLIKLSDATGFTTVGAGDVFSFSFTATNPSGTAATSGAVGTFYGRILTYDTTAAAIAYVDVTPGTPIDQGGVAMSTAQQLTTQARVQEQLAFCVGGTTVDDDTTSVAANCAATFTGSATCGSGTTIDLGILDNTATNVSPVSTANNGNGCNGAAMVQTNAANGVTIAYYAEPNGTNHTGTLRVAGATCAVGASNTDQCFNVASPSGTVITKGTEMFGVAVGGINSASCSAYTCTFGTGNNMIPASDYSYSSSVYDPDNGRVVASPTTGKYFWNDAGSSASPSVLATSASSSTKVVDDECLILKFAATAGITTPTGQYSVTSTYIATPVY